jgi:hypothetical protein
VNEAVVLVVVLLCCCCVVIRRECKDEQLKRQTALNTGCAIGPIASFFLVGQAPHSC